METSVQASRAIEVVQIPQWAPRHVNHGFFGRTGGASRGQFAELNLSAWVGDDPAAVEENWRRAGAIIGHHRTIALFNQVHGSTVYTIGVEYGGDRLAGDGMVTSAPDVILGIMTADCVPVLMIDLENKVCGALHAGWRGTLAGIVSAGLRAMKRAGATLSRLQVGLGPSIGKCCYEVDAELGARFKAADHFSGAHIAAGKPGKMMLDLRGVIADQFAAEGVVREAIEYAGPCTRCANDRFFSRRGAGGKCGLQFSFIGLRATE